MASQDAIAVIGGGPAGLAAACALADAGRPTIIIESGETLGGHAEMLACKATDRCRICGACVPAGTLRDAELHAGIRILTDARLTRFEAVEGGYRIRIDTLGGASTEDVAGIIVATGYRTIDLARRRQEFGHGVVAGVTTTLDLEQLIRLQGPAEIPARRFAFIQCVGSRDKTLDKSYCSRICCASSLRLARLIRDKIPDSEVTVFYQDLEPSGRRFEALVTDCEAVGVSLVRGLPAKVRSDLTGAHPVVCVADTHSGMVQEIPFDCVVLAVGIWGPETPELCDGLVLTLDEQGFARARQGDAIFAAGTVTGPMGAVESMDSGRLAAARLLQHLGHAPAVLTELHDTPSGDMPLPERVVAHVQGYTESLAPDAPSGAVPTAQYAPAVDDARVVFVMDTSGVRNRAAHIRAMRAAVSLGPRAAFLYRHAYTAERGMEQVYEWMRGAGVALHRYDDVPRVERRQVLVRDPLLPGTPEIAIPFDTLVVGEALAPSPDNGTWCGLLGLDVGSDGLLCHDNPHLGAVRARRRGIYVLDPARGILATDGYSDAAEELARALAMLDVRPATAEVDPAKCASCLTCQRVCPHDVPRMVWDGDRRRDVSFLEPLSCMSCGVCVAACPSSAITLSDALDERIPTRGGAEERA